MTNSCTMDAHQATRPKDRSRNKSKLNSTLGKEVVELKTQNHITKHELLDQSTARANLFPSEILGNTKTACDEHTNSRHRFFLLTRD